MLTDKLLSGNSGQSARKFLTFGITADSRKTAKAKLFSIKNDVIKLFKAIGVDAEMLDGRQRLETLYYSLNPYRNQPFIFDWDRMLHAGMDTKDFICPPSMKFNKQNFEIGNAYGAVWGMNILAGELSDEILKDFMEMQDLFCINIHVSPLDQIDALKFVKRKLTNVEQMKIDQQKKASQSGYDPDILPPAIKMYIEDIEKLLGDLNSKNERLFQISISVRNYADSQEIAEITVRNAETYRTEKQLYAVSLRLSAGTVFRFGFTAVLQRNSGQKRNAHFRYCNLCAVYDKRIISDRNCNLLRSEHAFRQYDSCQSFTAEKSERLNFGNTGGRQIFFSQA